MRYEERKGKVKIVAVEEKERKETGRRKMRERWREMV